MAFSWKHLFLSIDIYARPPTLLINKRTSFTTYPGSVFSILTIALFLYLFFSSEFFIKANPKVISQNFIFSSSPIIDIAKQTFPVFFTIADINGKTYNDSTIFQINVGLLHFVKNFHNLETLKFEKVNEKKVGFRKCTKKDLSKFFTNQEQELNIINQKLNLTCLEDDDLKIKGDFEENEVIQLLLFLPVKMEHQKLFVKVVKILKDFLMIKNQ